MDSNAGSSDGSGSSTAADDDGTTTAAESTEDGLDSSSDDGTTTTGDPPPPEVDPIPDPAGLASAVATTCRVDDDGTMTCWGEGDCGLRGDGTELAGPPTPAAEGIAWASVRAGWEHVCAIAQDRSLWCWGNGYDGKVGDGVLDTGVPFQACRLDPVEIAPGSTWARLSLGEDHSCGVQEDGTLWCWGSNEYGQIGDGAVGDLYNRLEPVEVGGTAWIDVFAGADHTCGLDGAGEVWCWGRNQNGQLGNDLGGFSSVPELVPVLPPIAQLSSGGTTDATCALTEAGAVWCWGSNQTGIAGGPDNEDVIPAQEITFDAPVIEMVMGVQHACALTEGGGLWCWGRGSNGQLGDGVTTPGHQTNVPLAVAGSDWVDVSVGLRHTCGRRGDGTTWCWGDNDQGQVGDGTSGHDNDRLDPVEVGPWGGGPVADDWAMGSVGGNHGCGVRLDGTLWCWGSRTVGQLGNDDPAPDCSPSDPLECIRTTPVLANAAGTGAWVELATGTQHTCARQDDGTLWCWGENGVGQLGYAGDPALVPTQVGAQTDWIAVEAGYDITCGLRGTGTLWCWGSNASGALGLGTVGGDPVTVPTQVGVATDWTALDAGYGNHTCGIRSDDSLWCWGRNDRGQVGNGMEGGEVPLPDPVAGTWADAAVGRYHTCAIATDGTLWCWGAADWGALGLGPVVEGTNELLPVQVGAASDWVDVQASEVTSCGRRGDGTLWCWGSASFGQTGTGTVDVDTLEVPTQVGTATDWSDVSMFANANCGQRGTTLWCWGRNYDGVQGNDTTFLSGTPREVRNDG